MDELPKDGFYIENAMTKTQMVMKDDIAENDLVMDKYKNGYESEVYDNAGNRITEPDGVATSFTVWVTPEEVKSVNLAVVYGGVQIYLKTK